MKDLPAGEDREKVRKIIGAETYDVCFDIYKKWLLFNKCKNPIPKELKGIDKRFHALFKKGVITGDEATKLSRQVFKTIIPLDSKERIMNLIRYKVKRKFRESGAPKYELNFLIIVLVKEMKARTGSEHYQLIEHCLSNEGILGKGDVKSQYRRWKNRLSKIKEIMNWVISSDSSLLKKEVLALRDRHFSKSSNKTPLSSK